MDVREVTTDTGIWEPLCIELDRWKRHGMQARFWLRDDDAVVPTDALDRLLALAGTYSVPITLAVIPKETGPALARHLSGAPGVTVALHGWSHENHAPSGDKKQELGMHRGADVVLEELSKGTEHLAALYGGSFTSVLVPPWNRIDAQLLSHLTSLGLAGLSTFGPERDLPLPVINTHVDLIDWKGTRGGRDAANLVTEIVDRLRQVFDDGGAVGILSHHLVHDETAWLFIEHLFRLTSRHDGCAWMSLPKLFSDLHQP
ncbi:MAG: polysaccharide deacetylase family protein [Boseongicola sp.]